MQVQPKPPQLPRSSKMSPRLLGDPPRERAISLKVGAMVAGQYRVLS